MSEKRVMQIKRGLMKSAKKLRLGAKRTGAYVYGTLRRIVGNGGSVDIVVVLKERYYEGIANSTARRFNGKRVGGGSDIRTGLREIQYTFKTENSAKKFIHGIKPASKMIRVVGGEMRRGLARNPMRSFASLHPSDRAKLNRFSDYVNSFYGKGGVYARDFKNGGFDRKTIERAIMVYIDDVRKGKVEWGDGDSIDRERVRMILQPSYSMSIPKGATILRPNRRMGLARNPAIPANMNNPKYVKVLKLAEMRAKHFGEPFGVYAYEGMDGPTFIARKPGEWPERYGELVTLITPKGKRGLRGNPSGPVTEGEVRLMFETHGIPLAEKGIFGSGYNALSQYGSVLKDSFKTADEAEEYTVKFYKMRPGLVRQDGSYRKAFRKARGLRKNPPMYAHGMTAHRTHGLSLKQMMKLYRLVSSGNPKAVMYARRTLGIPMSESLQQVKAVVYHHVLDLKGKI